MKVRNLVAAMALTIAAAPAAQASILSNYLTFDGPGHYTNPIFQGGGEDKLQDDSLSKFVDSDQSGGYSVGDYLFGIVSLSEIKSSGQPNKSLNTDQVAILYSAKIVGMGTGSAGSIQLGAVGNASDMFDLRNLLGADAAITGGVTNNSVAVIVSTANDPVGANDALNYTVNQFVTNFTGANGWSQEAVIGLVGTDDFFEFAPTATDLDGLDRGAFTVEKINFSSLNNLIDVDVKDFAGVIHKSDVTLNWGNVNLADADALAKGWTLTNQSTFYINVPEPASLALLGMGLLGMGVTLRKRKA